MLRRSCVSASSVGKWRRSSRTRTRPTPDFLPARPDSGVVECYRAALLAAADEFAAKSADASVADIARHAAVAKRTVCAHFPTKEDLLAAIIDRIESVSDLGAELSSRRRPRCRTLEFLTA